VPDSDPIPFQYAFTTGPSTISVLARAWLGHSVRQRSTVITYAIVFVVVGVAVLASASSIDIGTVLGACVAGTFPVIFCLAASYIKTRRSLTRVLPPGAVLQTGFGERALVTASPTGSSRLNYSALRSIVSRGPAVFLRINGSPVTNIFPRELFPDPEIHRVRLAIGRAGEAASGANDPRSS
jgi:hypothetical protein